jgi:hypothetical protein
MELVELRGRATAVIHHLKDQVMVLDLGDADRPLQLRLEVFGKAYAPSTAAIVV